MRIASVFWDKAPWEVQKEQEKWKRLQDKAKWLIFWYPHNIFYSLKQTNSKITRSRGKIRPWVYAHHRWFGLAANSRFQPEPRARCVYNKPHPIYISPAAHTCSKVICASCMLNLIRDSWVKECLSLSIPARLNWKWALGVILHLITIKWLFYRVLPLAEPRLLSRKLFSSLSLASWWWQENSARHVLFRCIPCVFFPFTFMYHLKFTYKIRFGLWIFEWEPAQMPSVSWFPCD